MPPRVQPRRPRRVGPLPSRERTVTRAGLARTQQPEGGGGISILLRRRQGSIIPYRIEDRRKWAQVESRHFRRIIKTNRGSVFTTGYEIPFASGGTPRLYGRLLRSGFVEVSSRGEIRYGWRRFYAQSLDQGYTLQADRRFKLPNGRWVTLKKGHRVKPRLFADASFREWWRGALRRTVAHHRSGKPWSAYR